MDLAARVRAVQALIRRRLVRPDVLLDMIRTANESLDPGRVGEAVLAGLADLIPAPSWLLLAAEDGAPVRPLASRALAPPQQPSAWAVGTWVLGTGAVFGSANLRGDRRLPPTATYARAAAMGFPLECRGRTMGAVVAIDGLPAVREPKLTPATLALFRPALEPGATALDNALRVQRAEALSVTDDLTQLYNSRYLSQVLHRETKRAMRSGRPLSLLFIDLDGFKSINDTHGHLFGSRALVEAAAVIRVNGRETDVVARFGGDEFSLVLPDTGSEGAFAVGERIRERVAGHAFLASHGLDIRLTVSVGVATLPDVASSSEELVQAADKAMYWIKEHGRNGTHVAGLERRSMNSARSDC